MSENLGSGKHSAVSTRRMVAELAAVDDVAHALRERVVAVVERFHHDEPGARRDRGDVFGFFAFAVNGFSHSTCLPASSAAIVHSACRPFGSGL